MVVESPCEHTLLIAVNEAGIEYIADSFSGPLLAAAKAFLTQQNEELVDEDFSEADIPFESLHEILESMADTSIHFQEWNATPPSGLAMLTAFRY